VRIRVDGGDLKCARKGSGRDKIRRVRRERDKSHQRCKVCSLRAQNSVWERWAMRHPEVLVSEPNGSSDLTVVQDLSSAMHKFHK
jgi:hypothetical protein